MKKVLTSFSLAVLSFSILAHAEPVFEATHSFASETGFKSALPFGLSNKILTLTEDGVAQSWNSESGNLLSELNGRDTPIIAIATDGKYSLTVSKDGVVKMWKPGARGAKPTLKYTIEGQDGFSLPKMINSLYSCHRFITTTYDGTIKLWDTKSGSLLSTFEGNNNDITAFDCISSRQEKIDVDSISMATLDGIFTSWHNNPYTEISRTHMDSVVSEIKYSPNKRRLLTIHTDKTARVWDTGSTRKLFEFEEAHGPVTSATYNPEGSRIISTSFHAIVNIRDAADGSIVLTLRGHKDRVYSANYSRNGKYIITASRDKTAKIWDANNGSLLATLEGHLDTVWNAYFLDDHRILTLSKDKTVKLWNVQLERDRKYEYEYIKFQPLLKHLYPNCDEASYNGDESLLLLKVNNQAEIWNAATYTPLFSLKHKSLFTGAQFSPDGTRIVSSGWDNARVWDLESQRMLFTLQMPEQTYPLPSYIPVFSVSYNSPGTHIVGTSESAGVRLWDAGTGALLFTLPEGKQFKHPLFNSDGTCVLAYSSAHTKIWNVLDGQLLFTLEGGEFSQFSPDGQLIVSGHKDGHAQLWDAHTGVLLFELVGYGDKITSAAFSSDTSRLITIDRVNTKIWDLNNGKLLFSLPPAKSAEFSNDGTLIVSASNNTAEIWDARNGKFLFDLPKYRASWVQSAKFSRDGESILALYGFGQTHIWHCFPPLELVNQNALLKNPQSLQLQILFNLIKTYMYNIDINKNPDFLEFIEDMRSKNMDTIVKNIIINIDKSTYGYLCSLFNAKI